MLYLSHSAISPLAPSVVDAIQRATQDYADLGLGAFHIWNEHRENLRAKLAQLIQAPNPNSIGLVANTTTAIISIAQCLTWKPQDTVITFSGEFPSNVTPWQVAAHEHDLNLIQLDLTLFRTEPQRALDDLRTTLHTHTPRLLAVSAVQFQTGLKMPLEAISTLCQETETLLFVDAIQHLGSMPFDVSNIPVDFLACGSHKWLLGPEGAAFLYIKPSRMELLKPLLAGWLSHQDGLGFLFQGHGHLRYNRPFKNDATLFEAGAHHTLAHAGWNAALDVILHHSPHTIFQHIDSILRPIEEAAKDLNFTSMRTQDPNGHSAILSLLPPKHCDVLAINDALNARNIITTAPDGYLRIAPHIHTPLDAHQTFHHALRDVLHELA